MQRSKLGALIDRILRRGDRTVVDHAKLNGAEEPAPNRTADEKSLHDIAPPDCFAFERMELMSNSEEDDRGEVVWRLSCPCGHGVGAFLGYPFAIEGEGTIFLSPLAFRCGECGASHDIFDTDQHGYHMEVSRIEGGGRGVHRRGSGEKIPWICSTCDGDAFRIEVKATYWSLEEIGEIVEESGVKAENLFNEIDFICNCSACGEISRPTDFGKM